MSSGIRGLARVMVVSAALAASLLLSSSTWRNSSPPRTAPAMADWPNPLTPAAMPVADWPNPLLLTRDLS